MTILFVVLMLRAAWVQIFAREQYQENPYNPRAHPGVRDRGVIVARDGEPIADSLGDKRNYPFGPALAHVVGYTSLRYGNAGLESVYDSVLSARDGAETVFQRLSEVVDRHSHRPARSGGRIVTTIEPPIQRALFTALQPYDHAAGIVLDVHTGAVVAAASVPSYDPNNLDADFPRLARDPDSALLDRAIDGLYPPGSTFKIVTAAAALQSGVVNLTQTFVDPGYLDVAGARIQDDNREATGIQTLAGAFARSSNVDFAQIALLLGAPRLFAQIDAFGFGQPLDFTLPTVHDHIPTAPGLSDSVLAQLAFGQADLLVSPLRMAVVAATVANGGREMAPTLIDQVTSADGRPQQRVPELLATPLTPATAAALTQMMIQVVNAGTGTAAALPTIQVAGKTGTATNPAGAPHAWFVGFAPADNPQYALAIIVENGGYGGRVAAPLAARVFAAALNK